MKLFIAIILQFTILFSFEYEYFDEAGKKESQYYYKSKKVVESFNRWVSFKKKKYKAKIVISDVLGYIGYCNIEENTVYLYSFKFANKPHIRQFIILAHEIAHCDKHIKHVHTLLDDKCPASIMFPYLVPLGCIIKHYNNYEKEMLNILTDK